MIINSTVGGPGHAPPQPARTMLVASVDVEWSKNYKIKNGNRAFCYSVAWLQLPRRRTPVDLTTIDWTFTSAYVDTDTETADLVTLAATDIASATACADLIIGHQLSSDLAVLQANAATPLEAVTAARQAWRQRHTDPKIIDTRYDASAILTGRSRRLVDVCTELSLDVTQPELAGKSMTALHRAWLTGNDPQARERISVLNLRHSLSAALVALRAAGVGQWPGRLNVNRLLHTGLGDTFAWTRDPTFQRLL